MSKALQRYVRVVVSLGLLGYLVSILDWTLVSTLSVGALGYLLVSAGIVLVALLLMSARWKLIIDHELGTGVSYLLLYRYYLMGSFFSIFLPSSIGGDMVRVAYSNKEFSLGWKRAAGIVVSERLFGLSALAMLFALGFLVNGPLLQSIGVPSYIAWLAVIAAVAIFFVAKHLAAKKIKIDYGNATVMLVLSGLGQMGDVIIVFLMAGYFQQSVTLLELVVVMPLVYIATMLPISLGGVGVREGVMVGLLAFLGVNTSIAILIALTLYLSKVTVGLLGAVCYYRSDKISISEIEKERMAGPQNPSVTLRSN